MTVVRGHYRRSKSGKRTYVKPHYRRSNSNVLYKVAPKRFKIGYSSRKGAYVEAEWRKKR